MTPPAPATFAATHRALAVLGADGTLTAVSDGLAQALGNAAGRVLGTRPGWVDGTDAFHTPLPDGQTLVELAPEAESRLREAVRANLEMRAIIENTFEFIGLLSPDGRLLDANRTAMSFIGHDSVAPFVGIPFADAPWWEHSSTERDLLLDAIGRAARGEFVRFETTHVDADGGIAYVDFSLKPVLDDHGRVIYLVPEGRDITQRKRAEAALVSAKLEAEAANRAKSNFLATVSHELRTPLNAVIGFSEAILSEAVGPADMKRCLDYLSLIHAAGQHLGAVIEDILDVSRIELGRTELEEEEVDPGELITSVTRLLGHKADSAGITLLDETPTTLPRLYVDARRLRQIILNLLGNAIKFTPENGTITVAAAPHPQGIEISVTDTGIGIAPEHQAKVWQAFYQADDTLARRHQGSGLGLAIVRHFVEAHGGSISLESTLGQGTRIAVILPRSRFAG